MRQRPAPPGAGPDWTLWRSFSAVVGAGSLSAAARELGLSQPTLGRHVEALEQALGTSLFERIPTGLKPTDIALRLYEQVERAGLALAEASMQAEGSGAALSGAVRITASTVTAHYTLPALLGVLRREFPAIQIELVPRDSPQNLLMRESDIAVRMFRPTQLELISQKTGVSPIVCCAHEDYLARAGTPERLEDLYDHELIGMDRSDLFILGAKAMGVELARTDFGLRSDSQTAIWELARAALGISFAQEHIIRRTPGMGVIPLERLNIPPLEVWLTSHRELYLSARIRAIYDRLAELLGAYFKAEGQPG
ncbi:MAG: LysR family transcriptional regulator [Alphaproteobacteria bacterium]|nr:LysR family transcriptional regulator [Alphaproteobacteria bacterium]